MPPPPLSIVLLASGLSRRFGDADKLMAEIDGRLILQASARVLASVESDGVDIARRIAVVDAIDGPRASILLAEGFELVRNPAPERGQGASLACAANAIGTDGAILVALADMPFVTAAHFARLIAAHDHADPAAATVSSRSGQRSPPVLFGSAHRHALAALDGDDGGRSVLRAASRIIEVDAPPPELRDIDTPHDLVAARGGR